MKRTGWAAVAVVAVLAVARARAQDAAGGAMALAAAGGDPAASRLEKAAYLGVTTSPVDETLAKQLGLPRYTGLVVTYVDPQSKAAGRLQVHDVLSKLNDQLLVNHYQFSVLIRIQKPADEIKLTVVREGKPLEVAVTLSEKELPPLSEPWSFPRMRFGNPGARWNASSGTWTNLDEIIRKIVPGGQSSIMRMHSTAPGGGRARTHSLNMGDGSSGVWTDGTGSSRVTTRQSDGTRSTFTLSENGRTMTLTERGGVKRLSVTDDDGKSLFEGPVSTDEDRAKVPADLQASLKELDGMVRDAEAEMFEAPKRAASDPAQGAH
jgi:hypothetical protein